MARNGSEAHEEPSKSDRIDDQLREGADAIAESASILRTVADKLDKAAARLSHYGEAPFGDLEREGE